MSDPVLETRRLAPFSAVLLLKCLMPLAAAAFVLRWPLEIIVQLILKTVTPFEGIALDGPFQLFNALRRMAAGQTPGVDFQYFHGLGLVYLHYPIFAWFGHDILASEFARDILSPAAYLLVVLAFAFAATRSFRGGWVVAALVLLLSDLAAADLLRAELNPRSLRSSVPILALALMLLRVRPLQKAVWLGMLTAIALALGAEHAIALFAAILVVQLFVLVAHRRTASRADWLFVPIYVLSTAAATGLVFLAMGHGIAGATAALRYALVELPRDQFWYFGTPPNPYVREWGDLLRGTRIHAALLIGAPFAAWALERAVRCRRVSLQGDRPVVAATLLLYALGACIGYLGIAGEQYVAHVFRAIAMAAILFVLQAWERFDGDRTLAGYLSSRPLIRFGALLACIGLVASNGRIIRLDIKDLQRNPPRIGAYWRYSMLTLGKALADATPAQRHSVWSTYAGMLEARLDIFPPAEDYIIHALGPARRHAYLAKFRATRPAFVQTLRRSGNVYEEWLQNATWDFYADVLENYVVVANTAYSILWKRKDAPWQEPEQAWSRVPRESDGGFTIPAPGDGRYPPKIIVVQVRYTIENPLARVPLFGATPRCFIRIENASSTIPVCVAPYESVIRFPVVALIGTPPRIRSEVRSLLPGVHLHIDSVEYRLRDLPQADAIFVEHLPPWEETTGDGLDQ